MILIFHPLKLRLLAQVHRKKATRDYWLKMNFKTPKALKNRHIIFTTSTGFAGESNTLNPQGMAFINGELVQALDINHTTIRLEPETDYEIYIYFYLGTKHENCNFQMWLSYIDDAAEQLCYDLEVPLNACRWVYEENSYEYAITMKALETACNMIDINYPYTDEFYEKNYYFFACDMHDFQLVTDACVRSNK